MKKSHTRTRTRQTSTSLQAQRNSLAQLVEKAEESQSSGNFEEAINLYKEWLRVPSPIAWAAQFNLGILLKSQGNILGAQQAFMLSLAQNPEFNEANIALASVTQNPEKLDHKNIQLFSLAWSPQQLSQTDPSIRVIDNTLNPRPDWREYWPMRQFLLNNILDEETYYAFLSPKFTNKTGLAGADVINFIESYPNSDVYTFSPQADMGAFFLNVFEQNDVFDPGFMKICDELFKEIGIPTSLHKLVMDSRHIVFSNFISARPRFWRDWLNICEKIFAIAENKKSILSENLNFGTTYPGQVARKVFIIERIASLLLSSNSWRCTPYDTYRCAWSALPTAQFTEKAIASDALKMAYNDTRNETFLSAYGNIRDEIFGVVA